MMYYDFIAGTRLWFRLPVVTERKATSEYGRTKDDFNKSRTIKHWLGMTFLTAYDRRPGPTPIL